jgi:hypothetical protein
MNTDSTRDNPGLTALNSLRRLARPRPARERCELCDAELAEAHSHLLEVSARRLVCACEACSILFDRQAEMKFRRVPRRVSYLRNFRLTDEDWEGLQLPINLAFFVRSTPASRVLAFYPSPAGATESAVSPEAWQSLAADNPVLDDFEPDVEALLINRVTPARDCFRVGIDECYRLVGLLRTHWRGLSGGQAAWEEIARFFRELNGRGS